MRTTGYAALAMLLAATVLLRPVTAQAGWDGYNNARFGFFVSYPKALLKPMPEAGNGDGREFQARSGTATIVVWGVWADSDLGTPAQAALEALNKCADAKLAYRVKKPALQVVSCVQGNGDVVYLKSILFQGTVVTFSATYPQAEKSKWDPVIAKMSRSFTALGSPL